MNGPVLAVVGLRREAQILASGEVLAVVGGGRSAELKARLRDALDEGPAPRGIISIGLAGGLDPRLRTGELIAAEAVLAGGRRLPVDPTWLASLRRLEPLARCGLLLGSDAVISGTGEKARLHLETRALAVDMESHLAAAAAAARGLPFAAFRVVSDRAGDALPPAALAGLGPDGGVDVLAVLRALCRRPKDLAALMRTGRAADVGFAALLRGRRRLGPALGFPDV